MNTLSNQRQAYAKKSAHVLIQSGRYADAREIYQKICNDNKNDLDAWLMLGAILGWLGDYNEAAACFRHVINRDPTQARACYNLALALQQLGNQVEAIEYYRKATDIDPGILEAWCNLGAALHRQGDLPGAATALRRAAALNPAIPQIHIEMASVLNAQGNHAEAIESANKALAVGPPIAEACCQIGFAHAARGKSVEAEAAFRKTLQLNPNLPEACHALGELCFTSGKLEEAAAHLQNAIRIKPDHVDAIFRLGTIHQLRGNPQWALACYQQAISRRPDDPGIHYSAGIAHESLGDHEAAIANYKKALGLQPDYEDAVAGIAHELEKQHRFEEARETVKPFTEKGTRSARLVSISADIHRHFEKRDAAIRLLERFLEAADGDGRDRNKVHFSLGKLYDEIGEYDKAFEQFRLANQLAAGSHDSRTQRRYVDECLNTFTEKTLSGFPHASIDAGRAVFIVGMPRSGTSLAENILASHPQVFGGGELSDLELIVHDLTDALRENGQTDIIEKLHGATPEFLDRYARRYLDRLAGLSGAALRVTDKMPHNFRYLGWIERLFPGARVIHCQRNPLDTCLSIYFQHFNAAHAYASDLKSLGEYYREYRRLMDHWKKTLGLPILDVRYEELVHDQEGMSRSMVEFCGLPWDDRCLRFYETGRVVNTPSYDQVRKPIYRKSLDRWQNYEKHIGELIEALGPDAAG